MFFLLIYLLELFLAISPKFFYLFCRDAFIDYWVNGNMLTMDIATQIFKILKQPDLKYLTQVPFFLSFIIYVC